MWLRRLRCERRGSSCRVSETSPGGPATVPVTHPGGSPGRQALRRGSPAAIRCSVLRTPSKAAPGPRSPDTLVGGKWSLLCRGTAFRVACDSTSVTGALRKIGVTGTFGNRWWCRGMFPKQLFLELEAFEKKLHDNGLCGQGVWKRHPFGNSKCTLL